MDARKIVRTAGVVALAVGAATAVGALVVRDQISRHQRDLFSSHPLQRLAAIGYLAGRDASVEGVQLLRDYISWEPRPIIRKRAEQVLQRMERDLSETSPESEEVAG